MERSAPNCRPCREISPKAGLALREPDSAPAEYRDVFVFQDIAADEHSDQHGHDCHGNADEEDREPLLTIVVTACCPDCNPTTATKPARPRSRSSVEAAVGKLPIVMLRLRYQPKARPASNAPPPLPSVSGMDPIRITSNPTSRPTTIPKPWKTKSVLSLWTMTGPTRFATRCTSSAVPYRLTTSPDWIFVSSASVSFCPPRFTLDDKNPVAHAVVRRFAYLSYSTPRKIRIGDRYIAGDDDGTMPSED